MILGGCDRSVTGELVPRRTRSEARNVAMLALLARVGRLEESPEEPSGPVTICFEPTELDEPARVLVGA